MGRSIFDIDAELDQIAGAVDTLEDGGLADEELLAAVRTYFGDILEERDAKLDKYAGLVRAKEASEEMRKAEAKLYRAEYERLNRLAKTDESTVQRLKNTLKALFVAKGWTKVETRLSKFWIQGNGGLRPIELVGNPSPYDVPIAYQKVSYEIDMDRVRADLEAGIDLPFAKLGERGSNVRIK